MDVLQGEAVVGGSGLCEVENITALACRCTLAIIGRKTWERLHERCGVSEISTKLGADGQVLDRINLGIHGREHLVLLVLNRVLGHIYDRVLARTSPVASGERSQTAIRCVWIPVREHEAASRDWGNGGVSTIVCLLCLLVSCHGVGTDLQPVASLHICIGADVVTAEGRALCDTILVVVTTRYIIVQAVGGTVDGKFVALERSTVVEHLVEPVDVHSRQEVVVLACIQAHFLLKLDALVGVHHAPVGLRQLRETVLRTEGYLRLVHGKTTLRCDDNHTVGSTSTIDRGRGSILQHGDRLDVVRTQSIEIGTRDRHTIQDKEW